MSYEDTERSGGQRRDHGVNADILSYMITSPKNDNLDTLVRSPVAYR